MLVFPLPANCPAPEVRNEFRIYCVSPHDKPIAYPLITVYAAPKIYAIKIYNFSSNPLIIRFKITVLIHASISSAANAPYAIP